MSTFSEIGQLILDGERTVRTAEDTHAKLLEMSSRHSVLEIACDGAAEVDLSFIQLLLAARTTAALANRTVRLARPATGNLLDALQRGGFLTGQPAAHHAFWS